MNSVEILQKSKDKFNKFVKKEKLDIKTVFQTSSCSKIGDVKFRLVNHYGLLVIDMIPSENEIDEIPEYMLHYFCCLEELLKENDILINNNLVMLVSGHLIDGQKGKLEGSIGGFNFRKLTIVEEKFFGIKVGYDRKYFISRDEELINYIHDVVYIRNYLPDDVEIKRMFLRTIHLNKFQDFTSVDILVKTNLYFKKFSIEDKMYSSVELKRKIGEVFKEKAEELELEFMVNPDIEKATQWVLEDIMVRQRFGRIVGKRRESLEKVIEKILLQSYNPIELLAEEIYKKIDIGKFELTYDVHLLKLGERMALMLLEDDEYGTYFIGADKEELFSQLKLHYEKEMNRKMSEAKSSFPNLNMN